MKKYLLKLIIPLSILGFIIGGCTGIPKNKVAAALQNLETCLQECSQKENICWNQYLQCTESARKTWNSAIEVCLAGPAADKAACLQRAQERYINALRVCETNYKNCVEEVNRCKALCNIKVHEELPVK